MDVKLDFREALRLDMERKGLTGAAIGRALGITQQAVHRWLERGFPPVSQLNALLELLGPDSAVSKLDHSELYSDRSRARTSRVTASTPLARYGTHTALQSGRNLENDIFEALPEGLRGNLNQWIFTENGRFSVDYAGIHVLAEFVSVFNAQASSNTHASMLRLATIAQMRAMNMVKLLIVVTTDPEVRLNPVVLTAAKAFGVKIVQVTSGAEAAKIIAAAEGTTAPEVVEPEE